MPWFKIDDGFHCHPKVFAAGTPAVGLYVRCGSWAAQQATDGIVPKHVAKMYGTPRMIKALIDAGLWHQHGHGCETCPELDANSYAIHQYLERNPSRDETEAARRAKSERQQRWRERQRAASVDGQVDASTGEERNGPDANSEGNSHRVDANSERNSHRNEDEFASSSGADSKQIPDRPSEAPQVNQGEPRTVDADVDASPRRHGDAAPNPSRPNPSPVPPTEVPTSKPDSTIARIGDRPRIPENARPLVDQITAAGIYVGWDLTTNDWFLIEALIKRCTIPALVQHAIAAAQGARGRIRSGTYFLPGWRSLPDVPADPHGRPALPAAIGFNGPQPPMSTTDQRVAHALSLAAELRALEGGNT